MNDLYGYRPWQLEDLYPRELWALLTRLTEHEARRSAQLPQIDP